VLPLLNKVIKKFSNVIKKIYEKEIKEQLPEINQKQNIALELGIKEGLQEEV